MNSNLSDYDKQEKGCKNIPIYYLRKKLDITLIY